MLYTYLHYYITKFLEYAVDDLENTSTDQVIDITIGILFGYVLALANVYN